jgi:hypothetical protein
MSIAFINPQIEKAVKACVAWAEANPVTLAEMERRVADPTIEPIGQTNYVEFGPRVRVAFSIEVHPGGRMRHMSISNGQKNSVPDAMAFALAPRFGFWSVKRSDFACLWTEEYEPKQFALNLLQLYTKLGAS